MLSCPSEHILFLLSLFKGSTSPSTLIPQILIAPLEGSTYHRFSYIFLLHHSATQDLCCANTASLYVHFASSSTSVISLTSPLHLH